MILDKETFTIAIRSYVNVAIKSEIANNRAILACLIEQDGCKESVGNLTGEPELEPERTAWRVVVRRKAGRKREIWINENKGGYGKLEQHEGD